MSENAINHSKSIQLTLVMILNHLTAFYRYPLIVLIIVLYTCEKAQQHCYMASHLTISTTTVFTISTVTIQLKASILLLQIQLYFYNTLASNFQH